MPVDLFAHQKEGVEFLTKRPGAMLLFEMGLGKTRTALQAALALYAIRKIDRILVIAPAAVRLSWKQEIAKFEAGTFVTLTYDSSTAKVRATERGEGLPVLIVSYGLLPQKRHVDAFAKWAFEGSAVLIADESSFLKNRTAKCTKGSIEIAEACCYRWLLTGTPIANSPLDLYGQALVMANGDGPLKKFASFYSFRARYAVLKMMNMGSIKFQQVVSYQNLEELTKKFAPYVMRRTKEECLDLPAKTYEVREIALSNATWRIYQELRKEAMLCLPDSEERPEPNAAVRILRLAQLTSGHVGVTPEYADASENEEFREVYAVNDVSSEKLDYLAEQILTGELANEPAIIVWTRWRRERERLTDIIRGKIQSYQVYGGQSQLSRERDINGFQSINGRRILIAQPHAGGFGLNLTAASMAVFLSNDFSFTTRVQAEDRIHRIGQHHPCLYLDVIATGPTGQRTVDHHVLECLRAKKSLAETTCRGWRKILEE